MAKCLKCKKDIIYKDLILRKVNSKNKNAKVTYVNYHKSCLMSILKKKLKDDVKAKEQFDKVLENSNKVLKERSNNRKLSVFLEEHYELQLPNKWFVRDRGKITKLANYRADWFLEFMSSGKAQKNLESIRVYRKTSGKEEIFGYNLLVYEIAILASKYHFFVSAKLKHKNDTSNDKLDYQRKLMQEAKKMTFEKVEKSPTKRDTYDDFLL